MKKIIDVLSDVAADAEETNGVKAELAEMCRSVNTTDTVYNFLQASGANGAGRKPIGSSTSATSDALAQVQKKSASLLASLETRRQQANSVKLE
jgi:hypothetical protein